MNNEEKIEYLPVGSVVLLKGGKKELMITAYFIKPIGKTYDSSGEVDNASEKLFDYGACLYPEGLVGSDQTLAFNHNDIEKVVFKGYETENSKKLSDLLNDIKNKKINPNEVQ